MQRRQRDRSRGGGSRGQPQQQPSARAEPPFSKDSVTAQLTLLSLIAAEAELQVAQSYARIIRRFDDAVANAHEHWPADVERWYERRSNWKAITFELELLPASTLIVAPIVHLQTGTQRIKFFLCRRGLVQIETSSEQRLPPFVKEPATFAEAQQQAQSVVRLAVRVLEQASDPFPKSSSLT